MKTVLWSSCYKAVKCFSHKTNCAGVFFSALFCDKFTENRNVLLMEPLWTLVNTEQVSSSKSFHTLCRVNNFYFLICCRKWHSSEEQKPAFLRLLPSRICRSRPSYEEEEDTSAFLAARWGRQVMTWLWQSRTPPWTPCASSVASSTGRERTTCTTTRMKWTTTWSATFAFSPCCSHWTLPADTLSATSA